MWRGRGGKGEENIIKTPKKTLFTVKLNGSIDLNSLPIQQMDGKVGDVIGLADKKSPFLQRVGGKTGQGTKKSIMLLQL